MFKTKKQLYEEHTPSFSVLAYNRISYKKNLTHTVYPSFSVINFSLPA
jgi:hypothetical protein